MRSALLRFGPRNARTCSRSRTRAFQRRALALRQIPTFDDRRGVRRPLGTSERKRKAPSTFLDRCTVASARWDEIAFAFIVVVSGNNTVEK